MKRFKPAGQRHSLSRLMVLVISGVVAAVSAMIMLIYAAVYNRTLIQNAMVNSEQTVTQVEVTVDNYLSGMKESLDIICAELAADTAAEGDGVIELAAKLRNDVAAVMIYGADGRLLNYGAPAGDVLPELKKDLTRNLSFSPSFADAGDGYAVTAPHVQNLFAESYPWVVTIARQETLPQYGGEVYVAMDFRFSSIASYVDGVGVGQHGYCYIIDGDGRIIYHPQQQMIFAGIKDEDTGRVRALSDGAHYDEDVIYTLSSLPDSAWRVVGVSYTDELVNSGVVTARLVFFLVALICVIAAVLMSLLLSRVITEPVRSLAEAMREFEADPAIFRYEPGSEPVWELETLSASFEHMVRIVQELLERVHQEEITLRKTELKALQAQINPHFLYNTLSSIQWMCEQGKNEDAVEMVGALGRLFRISISRGRELIPLREELEHARSYLIIQSHRYRDQFDYEFRADESVLDCLCNKITIQPLLENAIYHGIEPLADRGHIVISARPEDGDVVVSVEDNGVGMTRAQCESILRKDRTDSAGIGLKNVDDRLKIYFGEQYGVRIASEPDRGTRIDVRFPRLRQEGTP